MTRDEWEQKETELLNQIHELQEESDRCLTTIQENDEKIEEVQRQREALHMVFIEDKP